MAYDGIQQRFRDYQIEAEEIKALLAIDENSIVMDMGAGTGAFVQHAARFCKQVIAVDVSEAMLRFCRRKIEDLGLDNVAFAQGGFLSYEHQGPRVNAVVSMMALHHLPDHWKQVGLERLAHIIKPGGQLLLLDVVLPSQVQNLDKTLSNWITRITEMAGPELGREAGIHIKKEYSTYDWIMEGMLRQAGFSLEIADYSRGLNTMYLCRKKGLNQPRQA
ncbi:MAG: methyltransferase domain-containing protein [Desulfarculaceae bacterium]